MDVSAYPQLTNPACPWTPMRELGGLPNVKWCEDTLCSWVSEPANTWSNLAFLVTAAVLFQATRKETSRTERFWRARNATGMGCLGAPGAGRGLRGERCGLTHCFRP